MTKLKGIYSYHLSPSTDYRTVSI